MTNGVEARNQGSECKPSRLDRDPPPTFIVLAGATATTLDYLSIEFASEIRETIHVHSSQARLAVAAREGWGPHVITGFIILSSSRSKAVHHLRYRKFTIRAAR